ncbi:aa3-type cytochrome c oxidase subunit IV [Allosphingosinicella flava]|uniref:Aa3-type cytochrome c oxidase subunit IV n=1 Tax=Allosphingosinicella flava TaxID=2771430 RepID=A0A7T2LNE6_9SPHN|nr:aa3-type cytochrome c oxidase subunit IV [Sphingosinicella flava]QPQ56107.1 aa3-type cytochrome c oxidase subunit IV [Sphingosinicella flava]
MAADNRGNDLGAHVQDYSRFTGLMKWGTIVSFIVAAIVVLIIAN